MLVMPFAAPSAVVAADPETPVPTLKKVVVEGAPEGDGFAEEAPVGDYAQPEWTTERRFPGTRVYLQQAPWDWGLEQWVRHRHYHDGTSETRFQEEAELGLPHRFQVDVYETWAINQDRHAAQDEYSGELRYALADWGRIPGNPTLYAEYAQHNHAPNTLEGKLLLGGEVAPGWHWGFNAACEHELSRTENTEVALSQGLSRTLIDRVLSLGVECEYYHEKAKGSPAEQDFNLGPSLQWRPTRRSHLDLAALFGCTHESPAIEAYLVFGVDFGPSPAQRDGYVPGAIRGK